MEYEILALKNGECKVINSVVFQGGNAKETSLFYLYIWLILGGKKPILIDTGPKELEEFNRSTAAYIPGGVIQRKEEETVPLLRSAGVEVEDVEHLILTHLHVDHYQNMDLFLNAKVVMTRKAFEGTPGARATFKIAFKDDWEKRLYFVDDGEEVLPGISVFWIGGHTPCSQAIVIRTRKGKAILGGDTIWLYKNIEEDIPISEAHSLDECRAAMRWIRKEADIILPGHDPEILKRFPQGGIP